MTDLTPPAPAWRRQATMVALALAHVLAARWSLEVAFEGTNASPIWLPAGVAFFAVLWWGTRALPWLWLGAFGSDAATLAELPDLSWPDAGWASALMACGSVAGALVGAKWMRRGGATPNFASLSDVYVFVAGGLLASVVSACAGTLALMAVGAMPQELTSSVLLTWWLGDVTGVLVLTPLLWCLATNPRERWTAHHVWRALPAVVAVALACAVVFDPGERMGVPSRLLSALIVFSVVLAAYRHGVAGTSVAVMAVSGVALAFTLNGQGLFANATVNDSLISLDGFIILCALTGLVVASSAPRVPQQGGEQRQSHRLLPTLVLLLCLGLTLAAWHWVAADTERRSKERFDQLVDGFTEELMDRLRTYELVLEGGRGLFDATAGVTREDWRRYVSALSLRDRLPGTLGVGVARYVKADELEAHEQALRQQGMADYRVHPAGDRTSYTPIIYLEPDDASNQLAYGYDMLSDPVRREALLRAWQARRTAVSGPVRLVQDGAQAPQAAFVMYLPVFSAGPKPDQRDQLEGFVYAPLRVGDLMRAVLEPKDLSLVYVDLFDGVKTEARQQVFSSHEEQVQRYPKQWTQTRTFDVWGRQWSLDLATTPRFEATVDTQKAQITLVGGTLISLLVFSVMVSLTRHRSDALELAEAMTRERAAVETRLQSLAETTADAILVFNQDGQVDYCNHTAEALLGYPARGLLGLPLRAFFQDGERSSFADRAAQDFGTGAHRSQMVRRDGATVPVELNMSQWQVNGAAYIGMVVRDITDHLDALAQLEQSRSLFSNVLDNIPAMVGLWDLGLRNRYCNRQYEEWFGVSAPQAYGRHLSEVVGHELYQLNQPHIQRALAGERVQFERIIGHIDGRKRHAQVHYLPDMHDGVVKGFYVLVFDITPLQMAQQALQHNLKLHDLIFNHAGVGIALTRHRHYERASREFTRLLGYDEGELDGQPSARIFPDAQSYEAMRSAADSDLSAGRSFDLETALLCKSGETIWCHMLARAVDPQDPAQGIIWIVQDFRDRKQRQELLERARADAEDAARLKASFLANMSHEIRTPMNGIIGLTALTLESDLATWQRDNLAMVQDSARSLLGLLNDILDFSKIEAGKLSLEVAPFNLREQLSLAVSSSALVAWRKGVELVLDVSPEVPERWWGDALRLMQVVRNLVDNAAKFTEQGEIVCRVRHEPLAPSGARLLVDVTDTGPGVAEHIQHEIFEAFTQADGSVTRQYGGTGLGLSICSQLVTLMRGDIALHSQPGHGARFSFSACFDEVSAPPALSGELAAALRGRDIGVTVRSEALRGSIVSQLEAWGARVLPATAAVSTVGDDALWIVDAEHAPSADLSAGGQRMERVVVLDGPVGRAAGEQPQRPALRKPVKDAELAAMLVAMSAGGVAAGQPQRLTAAAESSADDIADVSLRILLAEDHPVNQRLASRLLEKRGHLVTLASNGAQAVELIKQQTFDVVLMDLQMPVMDGMTATRLVRAFELEHGRRTPIVALTAHAMKDELERLSLHGFDASLAKPFTPHQLAALVLEVNAARQAWPVAGTT